MSYPSPDFIFDVKLKQLLGHSHPLPSISGTLNYKELWNANTNTPALSGGIGTAADYYVVSVAGNTNLDGITGWGVDDWAIFNGTAWQKIDNSEAYGNDIQNLSSASGDWNSAYDTLLVTSGDWVDARSTLLSNSGDWVDSRTTVASNSGDWSNHTDISDLETTSGDWNSAHDTLETTSGDWNDARTTLESNSGDWGKLEYDYYVTSGSWSDLVLALESGTYATVFIPDATYTCTDDEATPLAVHANVKLIHGESAEGAIIDENCAVNTNITDFMTLPVDCVVKLLKCTNHGNGNSAAFRGTVNSDRTLITIVRECIVTDLRNANAIGFEEVDANGCKVINDSSVGAAGIGRGFEHCYNVVNCTTHYCSRGIIFCQSVSGNHTARGNYGYYSSYAVIGNTAYSHVHGINFCYGVDGNYVNGCSATGIRACTYVGSGNNSTGNPADYLLNTFGNDNFRDATDNTKIASLVMSTIGTGTTNSFTFPAKDGTFALTSDLVEAGRVTVTSDTTLTATSSYISVDPAAATDITLYGSPVNGQTVDINAIDLDYVTRIVGSINGVNTNHVIQNAWDNWHLIYNNDQSTWELR